MPVSSIRRIACGNCTLNIEARNTVQRVAARVIGRLRGGAVEVDGLRSTARFMQLQDAAHHFAVDGPILLELGVERGGRRRLAEAFVACLRLRHRFSEAFDLLPARPRLLPWRE